MPHGQKEDSYHEDEDICESCNGPLGVDAPLYEDADICRKCHNEVQEAEAAQPTNIAICKMPDWV